MKFENIFWPDSQLLKIQIEYDHACLWVWNDCLQKKISVECFGLAGVTNLCIWDDTIVENIYVKNADPSSDSYLQNVFSNYDKDFDCGGRILGENILILSVSIINNTVFDLYCKQISVCVVDDALNQSS